MMMPGARTINDYWVNAGVSEIETAACAKFGEPNQRLSTKRQLRFGTRGSKVVELLGEKAGLWHDFENGTGGTLTPPREVIRNSSTLATASCTHTPRQEHPVRAIAFAPPAYAAEAQRIRDARVKYDRASLQILGTPGEKYLFSRRFEDIAEIENGAGMRWLEDGRHASLVFPVRELTGSLIAIHRVFIHDDGSPVVDPRTERKLKHSLGPVGLGFYFARHSNAPDARWVVAEGPEDALSVALWFADWDTLDVNLVATCGPLAAKASRLLGNIEDVTLWAEPGQYFACAKLARRRGWKIVLGEDE